MLEAPQPSTDTEPGGYTVIARRYRPQKFEDVVGQDHVVQSLRNAIRLHRVTHAYLFSGTRGVGKTSIARIFAKCLNCVDGPTESPCLKCDICRAIAVGQDIDVIEIDGASNNGVEAVRELRQNAGLRPSRARFKIYYIDEVHMLSTGAFNALLKTLEEPPEHVKFFFATTEPNKIPITVLSRCQRYDFAGIGPDDVVNTLADIASRENVKVEREALRAVARRAGGSLRDAESLLEQLLSAGGETLTLELVHSRLGTASDERLLDMIEALAARDSAQALKQLNQAANEGVQPVDLLNGILEYLRDVLVLSTGAEELLLAATPRQKPRLDALIKVWPLDTVLAALQILTETRSRLRGSSHGRLLVELGLVRVARLESLTELSDLVQRLSAIESGSPIPAPRPSGAPLEKKKPELSVAEVKGASTPPSPPAAPRGAEVRPAVVEVPQNSADLLDLDAIRRVWAPLIRKVGVKIGVPLTTVESYLAFDPPNHLVARLPAGYTGSATECSAPDPKAKIEKALATLLGQPVTFAVDLGSGEQHAETSSADSTTPSHRKRAEMEGDPMIRKVVELFEARLLHLDTEDESAG